MNKKIVLLVALFLSGSCIQSSQYYDDFDFEKLNLSDQIVFNLYQKKCMTLEAILLFKLMDSVCKRFPRENVFGEENSIVYDKEARKVVISLGECKCKGETHFFKQIYGNEDFLVESLKKYFKGGAMSKQSSIDNLNKKGWEIPAFSNSEYSTSSGKEIKRMSVDHLRVINIKQRQLVSEIRVLEQAIDEIRKKMNCSHP